MSMMGFIWITINWKCFHCQIQCSAEAEKLECKEIEIEK